MASEISLPHYRASKSIGLKKWIQVNWSDKASNLCLCREKSPSMMKASMVMAPFSRF